MRGTGYILQYDPSKKRGMIHLGGKDHSALLDFDLSACDKTVRGELKAGKLPGGPAVKVQFEPAIKRGGLWAAKVCLAKKKAASKRKR
jgi:hypothetical protein